MAWLGTWAKRIKLTIDADDVSADLVDFPTLIYLSTASGISDDDVSCVFDELGSDANRKKIAVTTSDGTTQCYVEIEQWDDANEHAWLWVKVPTIDADVDEDLYLYYDDAQADNDTYVGDTNSAPAASVWDASFIAVYHMRDGADTSHIYDSTANSLDGTKKGAAEPALYATGEVSESQDFDGANDYINLSNSATLNPTTAMTLESWAAIDDYFTDTASWHWGRDIVSFRAYCFGCSSGFQQINLQINGAGTLARNAVVAAGFHYRAATGNAAAGWIGYFDGGSVATAAWSAPASKAEVTYLGRRGYAANEGYVNGRLDECRMSSIARPASYITATYETCRDNFVEFGTEETLSTKKQIMPRLLLAMHG